MPRSVVDLFRVDDGAVCVDAQLFPRGADALGEGEGPNEIEHAVCDQRDPGQQHDGVEFAEQHHAAQRDRDRAIIDNLLEIRKNHAFGEQNYYFDHPNTIGFTRVGDEEHPHSGVAVLISNGEDGDKVMNVGKQHAGETWKEATGNVEETVSIDGEGNGRFLVHGGNVAVWIPENALQDARKEDGK